MATTFQLELLKELYTGFNSSVVIMDENKHFLWSNHTERFNEQNVKDYIENGIIREGRDVMKRGEDFYQYVFIYIETYSMWFLRVEPESVINMFLQTKPVRDLLVPVFTSVRESIQGIIAVESVLSGFKPEEISEKPELKKLKDLIDAGIGRCYDIMRDVLPISELIKYGESDCSALEQECVNFSYTLTSIMDALSYMFSGRKLFEIIKITPEIYTKTDLEQLKNLLSILFSKILHEIEDGSAISIDLSQTDETEAVLTLKIALKENRTDHLDLSEFKYRTHLITQKYCETFKCRFLQNDVSNIRQYRFIFKPSYCELPTSNFKSPHAENLLIKNRLSNFMIFMSEFAQTKDFLCELTCSAMYDA